MRLKSNVKDIAIVRVSKTTFARRLHHYFLLIAARHPPMEICRCFPVEDVV